MFKKFFSNEKSTPVDSLIDAVMDEMHNIGVNSPEYPQKLEHLKDLYAIKASQRRDPISYDTIAGIGGNLMITILMLSFEQSHVITSKVMTFIRPNRQA